METRTANYRYSEASFGDVGLHKDLQTSPYIINEHGTECSQLQPQSEARDQAADSMSNTAKDGTVVLHSGAKVGQEEKTAGASVEGTDELQISSLEMDGNSEPGLCVV